MRFDDAALSELVDRLSPLGNVEMKRMFGGVGFFHDSKMFGMIGGDAFRLKVNETNLMDFEDREMGPFISGKKNRSMPYYEVPADVFDDDTQLCAWAQKSVDIAHSKKK